MQRVGARHAQAFSLARVSAPAFRAFDTEPSNPSLRDQAMTAPKIRHLNSDDPHKNTGLTCLDKNQHQTKDHKNRFSGGEYLHVLGSRSETSFAETTQVSTQKSDPQNGAATPGDNENGMQPLKAHPVIFVHGHRRPRLYRECIIAHHMRTDQNYQIIHPHLCSSNILGGECP
jgi:hypothetical protein